MAYEMINKLIKNNKIFLITPSPSNDSIKSYIDILEKEKINLVIKATKDVLYDPEIYKMHNIDYIELDFDDGTIPSDIIIKKLLEIIKKYNYICVHCKAGLGRAPVLVTLMIMFEFNLKPEDAIIEVKKAVPRAFNSKQLIFLYNFKKDIYIKKQKNIKKQKKCIIC